MQKETPKPVKYRRMSFLKAIRMYKWLYLMLIIPLSQYILFRYAPLSGLQVAFKEFSVFKGMAKSPWATPALKYFQEMFGSPQFWNAVRNTVKLNLLDLLFGFPVPIILAIMVYEMHSLRLKKVYQTMMYLPHFLSWVIIGSLVSKIFGTTGPINSLITTMGGKPVNFLMDEGNWVVMYVVTGIWQSAGWGTIIYLAAISGVNTELYEAAEIDGATGIRQFFHITVPLLSPTTFFIVQTRVIGALTIFDLMFMVMDKTNLALENTQSIVYLFYTYAFTNGDKGYGATIVVFLVIFIMIVTFIMQRAEKKLVYHP